ncbi:piggyBac transposable element-derived protein 4-like [Centruroides sculpturatus]|uniref:piggyBac transposable element-derived protein 4-like n=1 Tax=Centruroides sculpturatus TaxID=218467 RepID=UPI000C6C8F80|nr:piggyBac transposable element-derived protein 4-like [Centruroides sculpturatus]
MASSSKKLKMMEEDMTTYLDQLSDKELPAESDTDHDMYYTSSEYSSDSEEESGPTGASGSTGASCSHQAFPDELEDEGYLEVLPPEQSLPDPFPFLEQSGPLHMPLPDSHPIQYFHLFFTMSLLSLMATETNRYAQQVINGMGGNVPQYLKKWQPVTVEEIKGFLAFILNMGLNKKSSIASYWSTSDSQNIPWFGRMFTKHRFSHLLRFFHLVDNSKLPGPRELGYDPSAKYQPLEDHANKVFRQYYIPHQEICVDESMVGTKCRSVMRQFMREKNHHQWGVKLWVMCDSISHYCLGFFTYKGAKFQAEKRIASKFGLAYTVVCQLLDMGDYNNKAYHVFMDNFYTSVPLIRHLYSQGTYCTGTVRKNRKELPLRLKNSKFTVGQIRYFRSGPILACGFRDKKSQPQYKPVILLSSHAGARDNQIDRREGAKLMPEVVSSYNKFMGGIDTFDMMLNTYLDERRTKKYWKKVAFNIIARMMLNAYILYTENYSGSQRRLSHVSFIEAVVESLGREWMEEREAVRPPKPRGPAGLRKLPGKTAYRCIVCSTSKHKRPPQKPVHVVERGCMQTAS